ncbi:MAG TPA: hypothetical protein VKT70_08360 [Stellaceae bacterium]|nr:hypothetical protein [Stellaceae bacterium]
MMIRLFLSLALAGAIGSSAFAAGTLTVCLEGNTPPYSLKKGEEGAGFDVQVAGELARRLDRTLKIQWFETEQDHDSNPPLDANALLSDGLCDVIAGYPLFADALGKPESATATLPDHDGAKPGDRRRRVKLGTLIPSHPYHFAPLTVVMGPTLAGRPLHGLADLSGTELGAEEGTLSDTILMAYGGTRLANSVTHVVPGHFRLLERLERGDFEAVLIELHRFDAYRALHSDTRLSPSGWYHPLGFNMGFVALDTEARLIEEVNRALADMLDKGSLAPLAEAAGMTYLPPREPQILETISVVDLYRN